MTDPSPGLRERKKQAARLALAQAALRLALERGADQLRVEDIANEVGVSPRTFNNYFSSKEEAVCSFIVEQQQRVREALLARPAREPLWEAVINASVERQETEGAPRREDVWRLREMMHHAGLFGEMLRSHAKVELVLAEAIAERAGEGANPLHARMMAGIVQTASRIAFHTWLTSDSDRGYLTAFVELLREARAGMPALTAAAADATPAEAS
ncbi:TetR/AcrR family transcriptional regulator [Amycolatopsis jiangsuensis]|uniref:AcrR family transcriptional regulator n=1 Tax=Amycolatopsis jiangsuensis TaxID=1181879 RepID=A0A840IPW4_9PSEU|nr:TetR/AcrR family transcriptional regulator [Amycolatopsis jiangsuensis]MBB4683222.1 AcrR family transcriptional regulator [Amycolatopsis jiangsuensis]